MNKKLLMLTGAAVLTLASCEFSLFGNKGNKLSGALAELNEAGAVLTEFQGHKLTTKVEDGKEYYLGVYRRNEDLIRFANGDYHRDDNGSYPFYMGTVGGTTQGAATVKVEMLEGNKFGLKVICDPSVPADNAPWNGKYIGVYAAISSFGNDVTSIALLDDPTQTTYNTIPHQNNKSQVVSCSGIFEMIEYYDDMPAAAPAIMFEHEVLDEGSATPKFFGTGHNESYDEPDYTSFDAKNYIEALNIENYDLMHLYTK